MPSAASFKAHAAVAVLALVAASPSQALRRSHDGAGQAVLVPYYSVVDDRATLLSIVNHADTPKAVRFVLAEGRNGRAALTFNIYLAARDSWVGALVFDATGARLNSNDDTCTVPSFPSAGVSLRNFAYTGTSNDNLGTDVARLREGQFEAIEMGVLVDDAAALVNQRNCAALVQRFTPSGIWSITPNLDLAAPSGHLSASALLVNVAAGSAFDVPSVALDQFGNTIRHAGPGDIDDLRFGRPTPLSGQTQIVVEDRYIVDGDQPGDAVSLLLMAASMEGGFSVDPGLAATTEYVIAFPTRNHHLDDRPGGVLERGSAPTAPFGNVTGTGNAPRCNAITWETIARNGNIVGAGDASFPTPINDALCAQVNRVTLTRNLPAAPGHRPLTTRNENNGRLRLGLRPDLHQILTRTGPGINEFGTLQGLPVLVVPLIEAQNTAAQPGKLATYGYSAQVVRRRIENSL